MGRASPLTTVAAKEMPRGSLKGDRTKRAGIPYRAKGGNIFSKSSECNGHRESKEVAQARGTSTLLSPSKLSISNQNEVNKKEEHIEKARTRFHEADQLKLNFEKVKYDLGQVMNELGSARTKANIMSAQRKLEQALNAIESAGAMVPRDALVSTCTHAPHTNRKADTKATHLINQQNDNNVEESRGEHELTLGRFDSNPSREGIQRPLEAQSVLFSDTGSCYSIGSTHSFSDLRKKGDSWSLWKTHGQTKTARQMEEFNDGLRTIDRSIVACIKNEKTAASFKRIKAFMTEQKQKDADRGGRMVRFQSVQSNSVNAAATQNFCEMPQERVKVPLRQPAQRNMLKNEDQIEKKRAKAVDHDKKQMRKKRADAVDHDIVFSSPYDTVFSTPWTELQKDVAELFFPATNDLWETFMGTMDAVYDAIQLHSEFSDSEFSDGGSSCDSSHHGSYNW